MKNKIKTHKATSKRFQLTTTGRLRHNKQGDNAHLKIKKNRAQKARLKGKSDLSQKTEIQKVKRLIRS